MTASLTEQPKLNRQEHQIEVWCSCWVRRQSCGAPPGARGLHRLDDPPDLSCENGTARYPVDGREATHDPPFAG